ncbi:6-phosphofructo-2-kinase [Artemisia annua]|uniref:6-phosphofructo-2-kinase n=1 Tax=Artemisia annua TaxID=35608 RepID=A0A2U1QDY1_ARTAN|nr:6-phosphofructo-2-kinase [Artemisia annua]
MGSGPSKNPDSSSHGSGEEKEDHGGGGQLYVSLKMKNYNIRDDLVPHVYGSVPLISSWDSSKAVLPTYLFFSSSFIILLKF